MKKIYVTKEQRYDILCYVVMVMFAVAMLLLFSRETSPLFGSSYHMMDSIQYKSVGKKMLDGYVPFKDSFQQKGVTFFYIQAVGEWLCRLFNDDRLGTLLIQFVNFIAILGIMYSISKILLKKVCGDEKPGLIRGISLLAMCPALYVYVATFIYGNYTEEYSIPFNLISVWLCAKYIERIDDDNPETYIHKPFYAFIHAVLFSFTFWIRPNNCIGVCTAVAFIVVLLFIKKQYKNLFQNAGMFILGLVSSSALFLSYYIFNGALSDLLYCQFAVNLGYVSVNSKTEIGYLAPLFLCIAYGLYMMIIRKKDFLLALLCEIMSVCMLLMYLILGSQYPHYNMFIMIPVFLFTLLVIRNVALQNFKNMLCLQIIIPFLLFCGFSYKYTVRIVEESYYSITNIIAIHRGKRSKTADSERLGKILKDLIPDKSKHNMYVYPPNIDSYQIYYYSDTCPFFKYSNPGWYEYVGSPDEAELFYTELYENSPDYVVVNEVITNIEEIDYSERTEEFIENECDLWHTGDGFKIYKKK